MKFTICDDTLSDLTSLESILNSYSSKNNINITIEKYNNPHDLLENFSKSPDDYSIFFLDIVMQENGIEIARKIRQIKKNAIVVFTTSSKEFAIDAFGVRAYDYILKPLVEDEVFECLNRLLDELKLFKKTTCKIKTNDLTITSFSINEVICIESINRRIQFYLENGDVITSTTLHSKFLDSIPFEYNDYDFINCHASFIVNMRYIKSISDKFFVLKNEKIIPISKSMLSVVKKRYINFLVGE